VSFAIPTDRFVVGGRLDRCMMPDRMLQNHNCVAALQQRLSYNTGMNFPTNHENGERAASTWRTTDPWRGSRFCRVGLIVVALLGIGVLVGACGGGSPGQGVVSLGKTPTATGSSAAQGGSVASRESSALAYTHCMRTHGEPNMPEPSFRGGHISISISAGSGVDPASPQFKAANNACRRLVPKTGGRAVGNTITPAEQADYLRAAACMRSHGVPNFPDPTFEDDRVEFNSPTLIDTNSSEYKSAVASCQKLIPAGLPDSSSSGS
jgi:hypothetical protein